jgi:hypothetical protein
LRAFSFSLTDITSERRVLLQKSVAELVQKLPDFYKIKTHIPFLQKPTAGSYIEPNKSDLQPHN